MTERETPKGLKAFSVVGQVWVQSRDLPEGSPVSITQPSEEQPPHGASVADSEQTSDDMIERFLDHLEETGVDETDLLRDESVGTADATSGSVGPVSDDLSAESGSQDDRLAAIGRRYFSELAPAADLRIIPLDDGAGVCVVHTARGGGKIYVAPDESVLFVGSAMDFDTGLAAFLAGTRTPPEKFVRPTT